MSPYASAKPVTEVCFQSEQKATIRKQDEGDEKAIPWETCHFVNIASGSVTKVGKQAAFTLAEVLITLGIIGVVAAMTLPTIISNNKKIEASSRLKKFYSMMSQAILLSEKDNGEAKYWDKNREKFLEGGTSDLVANAQEAEGFFNKYIAPYIKYTSIDKAEHVENPKDMKRYEVRVILSDGSILYLHNGACTDFKIDINGSKKPNEYGKDRFAFIICPATENNCGKNKYFCSYNNSHSPITTRKQARELCKANALYCSTLLMYDNWEFKDDYPYKF